MRWWTLGLIAIFGALAGCQSGHVANLKTLGAVGDGKTSCTQTLQKALDACAAAGGGEVIVPAGEYLIGSVVMGSNATLRLEKGATLIGSPSADDYPLMDVRWEGRWREGHRALIHAKDANNIAIVGEGAINGDLKIGMLRDPRGPCIFEPIECKNVRIEGISVHYHRMWTIHLTYCDNVIARNLTIRSERDANGDGIDVDSSRNIRIEYCDIDTGDDAIALKSGRGMEGVRIGRPTENVTITDCRLGSAFAGLAIGTEMSGGVRNVRFSRCTFTRGSNGIFIKSRTGRGGFMEDIEGHDVVCDGPKTFLRFDLTNRGIQDSEPVEGDAAFPRVGNIRISNVKVANCDVLVEAPTIAPEKPVTIFSLTNVSGMCKKAIHLNNFSKVELRDIKVTGFEGPLLTTENVTGMDGKQLTPP
jgi:polygalacturonase